MPGHGKFYGRYLGAVLIGIAVVSIGSYAYLKTKDLLGGVSITIETPQNFQNFSTSSTVIKGTILRSSAVYLNDRKIFLDEEGAFEEKLILSPGLSIITLRAEDRFGRKEERKLTLSHTPD